MVVLQGQCGWGNLAKSFLKDKNKQTHPGVFLLLLDIEPFSSSEVDK